MRSKLECNLADIATARCRVPCSPEGCPNHVRTTLICIARKLREECRSGPPGVACGWTKPGAAKRNSGAALQAKRPAGRSARVLYCGGVEVPVAGVAAAAAGAAGAVSAVGAAAGGVTGAAGVAAGGASAGAVGAV